jgi:excisionase family DNA binding protein
MMFSTINKKNRMGLLDYLKTQLLDIIQWEDDSRNTLSWRFPDEDKEIKRGAQLIVRESQAVQFIYLGQFGDTFGPGKHTLVTDNIPILSTLKGWKYGFESPFKADVYFVNTRLFTGQKWGTSNPVMMRDPDFGIVRARAFGTYDFKVVDVKTFLKEVAGTDHHFTIEEFQDAMRSRIVSVFTDALASSKVPVLDVASRYQELGEALLPLINPQTTAKYGLEVGSFIVENVSLPPEVEQAIDKRSSMAAVGNLNDYVKFQMAESIGKGDSSGGGGMAAAAAQLGAGLAMGNQMVGAMGGLAAPQATPGVAAPPAIPAGGSAAAAGAAASSGIPELLTPGDAARALGVTEGDVQAALTDGSLKGKKIGAAWRITRQALEEFLKS